MIVTVLAVLILLNLLLTAGLVRRLNEHTVILDRLAGDPDVMRPAGETVSAFTSVTTDGTPLTRDDLPAPVLVAFLSPTCAGCHEQLPALLARAVRAPGGRTLAVVVEKDGNGAALADVLGEVTQVVVESRGGPLTTAFGVRGYPSFALLGADGRIEAADSDLAAIPILVEA
ncbi:TlpA family protein disulfide reductase [Catenuloplanes japonicus]|uniref:TlpA family protein disulfide reductase n=1 Tax=Catenuloplanes japonicus TaxID=33876 RepID=UPI0006898EB1|nr:TlpA disulfide reductase family protein [Catenuloplanes japonicus]